MPATLQMLGELLLNITPLTEPPPVADNTPVPPTVMAGAAPKVIVCVAGLTVNAKLAVPVNAPLAALKVML